MIIARLYGGLGNQMFQYAAGLALAERRRAILKIDVLGYRECPENSAHARYGLSCFNITEQFATREEIDHFHGVNPTRTERWAVAVARGLKLGNYVRRNSGGGNFHSPPTAAFYPGFLDLPDDTYLCGLFQSERFFGGISGLVRAQFSIRYPSSAEVAELARRISGGPSIAVQFRRGDYVGGTGGGKGLGVVGIDYYQRAVAVLRERSPAATLYVFSDDIEAVRRDFKPEGPHHFVCCPGSEQPYESMRLMALCEHMAIANSTFSWWAAWLNPNPDKLVIAPEPWFEDGREGQGDIVPQAWRRLPR